MKVPNHPLHEAAANNDLDGFKECLEHGKSIADVDSRGITTAEYAALTESLDVLQFIISEDNTQVNRKGSHNRPPLHRAAEGGQVGAATTLLDAGADVNAESIHGLTALHVAAARGMDAIVQLLVDRGADVNAVSTMEASRTPLDEAEYRTLPYSARLLEGLGGRRFHDLEPC